SVSRCSLNRLVPRTRAERPARLGLRPLPKGIASVPAPSGGIPRTQRAGGLAIAGRGRGTGGADGLRPRVPWVMRAEPRGGPARRGGRGRAGRVDPDLAPRPRLSPLRPPDPRVNLLSVVGTCCDLQCPKDRRKLHAGFGDRA